MTLISSAFTALLNCAEVGRRNRILTNDRFLFHSLLLAILTPIDYNKEKLYGDNYDNQIPKDFYNIEKPD